MSAPAASHEGLNSRRSTESSFKVPFSELNNAFPDRLEEWAPAMGIECLVTPLKGAGVRTPFDLCFVEAIDLPTTLLPWQARALATARDYVTRLLREAAVRTDWRWEDNVRRHALDAYLAELQSIERDREREHNNTTVVGNDVMESAHYHQMRVAAEHTVRKRYGLPPPPPTFHRGGAQHQSRSNASAFGAAHAGTDSSGSTGPTAANSTSAPPPGGSGDFSQAFGKAPAGAFGKSPSWSSPPPAAGPGNNNGTTDGGTSNYSQAFGKAPAGAFGKSSSSAPPPASGFGKGAAPEPAASEPKPAFGKAAGGFGGGASSSSSAPPPASNASEVPPTGFSWGRNPFERVPPTFTASPTAFPNASPSPSNRPAENPAKRPGAPPN